MDINDIERGKRYPSRAPPKMDIDDNTRVKAPNCMRIEGNPNPTRAGKGRLRPRPELDLDFPRSECNLVPERVCYHSRVQYRGYSLDL